MVYFDNAATTPVPKAVADTMYEVLTAHFGNPSSQYPIGVEMKKAVEGWRAVIAGALGCPAERLYFTSCGTESDNWAIQASLWQNRHRGRHIITTAVEHSAVLEPCKLLAQQGYEVTYLKPGRDGNVTAEQVADALREDTALVSIMFANNEIGSIQPIEEIGALCHEKHVLFHTDAVQAAGHVKIDVNAMHIDLLSLSAHKFHGPKGVGMLYARRGIILTNLIEGGAQERGKRGGTENVPGIAAMAAALTEACANMDENTKKVTALRNKLIDGISKIPHCALNGAREPRLPGNVNFCFEGIEGESLLLLLDAKGISASSGSACTSGSLDPSHVLLAIGRPHEVAHGSLRLTICEDNTEEEIDYILAELPPIVDYLRNMSPVWKDLMSGKRQFTL